MKQSKNLSAIAAVLGLALGLAAASAQVSASDQGLIDSQAINDYTDPVSAPEGRSADRSAGYTVQVVLDEAYFDYVSDDIAAYRQGGSQLGRTEFAAFEPGTINALAWELSVAD